MYGWEKLTSACGLSCKVFWSPWAHADKPYDPVLKLDELDPEACDVIDDPVTSAPQKPDWGDMSTVRAPIVKNKSNSVTNISRAGSMSYEKLPAASGSMPKLNNKRLSKPELLSGSRSSLTGSRTSLAGSTTSTDTLEVTQMVTTV